ncbi:MAG: DNA polymerase IV [Halanaerobiales bacterium]
MALEIMHIDMDAFFAAVEQLDNPELKGKPVIVGGVGLDNRGVVSAASYEARKYGVHSAMPMVQARSLCPDGIYLQGRHYRYSELSRQIFDIFYEYTPLVEGISIDEAFLDLTGCHRLFGDSIEIGKKIKSEIQERIGLTASVGLAPNKFLAKLASGMDKPDGFFIIPEDRISEILEPLPVGKIWGVGKKTEETMQKRGIETIATLKKLKINELEAMYGKMGVQLYHLARGIDNRDVKVDNQIKSISHEETFQEDVTDKDQILSCLLRMSSKVSRRLRKNGFEGSTIFIKVRYGDFTTYSRRLTISIATNDIDQIYGTGKRLLEREKLLKKPVRLLGIGVSNLSVENSKQLSLFNDRIKEDKLNKTIDGLKDKFGDGSVIRARNLD